MSESRVTRILMTGDTVGGVWTFTLDLAAALAPHGIEVTLAALGGEPTQAQYSDAARIPNLRLLSRNLKLEWMDDPWEDVAAAGRWLLGLETEFQPDVVHLNSYGQGALPWQSPVVLTAHSCVVSWWDAVKHAPLPGSWRRYREQVTRSVRSADLLTAPSHAMMRSVEEHYGPILPERRVIANGRSADRFHAQAKEAIILTAGRLRDEAKNAAVLAKVARNLAWPVYMAGESANFGDCRMLGPLAAEELARWYGRASIYALPARYEPFGLSVLEAALSECALVLGDIASLRENWDGAAVFVPPDDPEAIERAIAGLIENSTRRRELARRAALRALDYTPERMAGGFLAAYAKAADRRIAWSS